MIKYTKCLRPKIEQGIRLHYQRDILMLSRGARNGSVIVPDACVDFKLFFNNVRIPRKNSFTGRMVHYAIS